MHNCVKWLRKKGFCMTYTRINLFCRDKGSNHCILVKWRSGVITDSPHYIITLSVSFPFHPQRSVQNVSTQEHTLCRYKQDLPMNRWQPFINVVTVNVDIDGGIEGNSGPGVFPACCVGIWQMKELLCDAKGGMISACVRWMLMARTWPCDPTSWDNLYLA